MADETDIAAGGPLVEHMLVIAIVLILGLAVGISLGMWMSSDWLLDILGGA